VRKKKTRERKKKKKNEGECMSVTLWWGRSKKKGRGVRGWWGKKGKKKGRKKMWYVSGEKKKKGRGRGGEYTTGIEREGGGKWEMKVFWEL
jgi:hypothetical protein